MDALIQRFDSVKDRDLRLCPHRGVAYQRDMSLRAPEGVNAAGENYFDHYAALAGNEIAARLHAARVELVNTYVGAAFPVLDVGIGCGEFISARPNTYGTDVNPRALVWLQDRGLKGSVSSFEAFTFWDVLEHIDKPDRFYFRHMAKGSYLFTSLPIVDDLNLIRQSKHYKPGEHLYYWTERGFVDWMAQYRFRLLASSDMETKAGREQIKSFVFVRDLPGYHETLDQYREMHARAYGASAYLYFEAIAREVLALRPGSVLDYGCGRSDLVAHFWADGMRRIGKYDPAIPQFATMPEGDFDLALCTDVMEHVPMTDVERIFREIRAKARQALFTISTVPARAKLPDGRNAHVSLLSPSEWLRWVKDVFGRAVALPTHSDGVLMVKTW